MSYKMKGSPAKLGTIQGTSGHKAALNSASPNKFSWKDAGKGALIASTSLNPLGIVAGGLIGGFMGEKKDYGEWQDTLEEENLDTNMWTNTLFGIKRNKERKKRIKELEAQKKAKIKLGNDRDRIAASTGSMAGAGVDPNEPIEEETELPEEEEQV